MKKFLLSITLTAALLLAAVLLLTNPQPPQRVLAAGITPVGGAQPLTGKVSNLIPFATVAATADGQICRDTREWRLGDLQTVIDITEENTVTLKLEHSNDNANYTDGPQLAATVTADASYLNRYDTFGAFTCITWDVATTNTVGIKVLALLKQ